jgi:Zn-dependent protease/CBS domain-containing protein
MRGSLKLFRIAGIDIGIHFSWIFIFVFFAWTLAASYFPTLYPNWSSTAYWIIGIITSLLLFVSVLIHEIAHSLVARARGLPVNSITLFILGGVSNLEEEPKAPMIEFSMAVVGPLTSLLLALIFWLIVRFTGAPTSTSPADLTTYTLATIGFLAYINLVLGIFNLLPGFPMDGGRVLRSIIWGATKNLTRATDIAGIIGQVFGWALIALGVYYVIIGAIFSGIWAAFIGWFLMSAADSSRKEVKLRERLGNVKVRELMNMNVPTISPDTSVQDMVSGIFRRQHDRAVPVCQAGQLTGIATIDDIRKVPQDRWANTPVKNIMTSDKLYTVAPDDNLTTAYELIARHNINQVLIKDGGQCAGLLTRADIIRYIQMSQELGISKGGSNNPQT